MLQHQASPSMTRRRFVQLAGLAGLAIAGVGFAGCASGAPASGSSAGSASGSASVSGSITALGSTALQPLVEAAAEEFMALNPNVSITVQGGGSGQGISQIVQGSVQIGNSDVYAEEKIKDAADLKKIADNQVCVVGMGPMANPDSGVKDLTLESLRRVFFGEVTNWKELGGADKEIVVINRAAGSGTRATFEGNVFGGQKAPDSFKPQEQDSSGTVAKMVASTPGAISYLAFSYFKEGIVALSVDGVAPSREAVESGDWKIWAYEHMYTAAEPDAATKAFIEFMLGEEVQGTLVEATGYIPVSGMKVKRAADGTVSKAS